MKELKLSLMHVFTVSEGRFFRDAWFLGWILFCCESDVWCRLTSICGCWIENWQYFCHEVCLRRVKLARRWDEIMVLGDYNTFMLPSQYGGMLIGFVDHGYLAVWYLLENLCMIWIEKWCLDLFLIIIMALFLGVWFWFQTICSSHI